MLTPCFVTTLHSGPAQFTRWDVTAGANEPLTHLVDYLILDEAGQIAPHLPAALMNAARTAVVIGDREQLRPVSRMTSAVDRGNARVADVASTDAAYDALRSAHVWAGSDPEEGVSSVMGHAQGRTVWGRADDEPDRRGLWLTDHYRCVTPIIRFCNELAYDGRIVPRRDTHENAPHPWPTWGYAPIWGQARRQGGGWVNLVEAATIAEWLKKERSVIEGHYDNKKLEECVAIITPFHAQGLAITQALEQAGLKSPSEKSEWKCGTIHGMQGAERRLVIFSPVYTLPSSGKTYFFDRTTEMLNVAVSRAQDSFWVFGDPGVLDPQSTRPSGLLARYLRAYGRELAVTPCRRDHRVRHRLESVQAHSEWLSHQWDEAQTRILIVSPYLSPRAIRADGIEAGIRRARDRRVAVTVYHDAEWATEHPQATQAAALLTAAGAAVVPVSRVHAKILVVDDHTVAEGSFNWLSAEREVTARQRWDTTVVYRGDTAAWVREIDERLAHLRQQTVAGRPQFRQSSPNMRAFDGS